MKKIFFAISIVFLTTSVYAKDATDGILSKAAAVMQKKIEKTTEQVAKTEKSIKTSRDSHLDCDLEVQLSDYKSTLTWETILANLFAGKPANSPEALDWIKEKISNYSEQIAKFNKDNDKSAPTPGLKDDLTHKLNMLTKSVALLGLMEGNVEKKIADAARAVYQVEIAQLEFLAQNTQNAHDVQKSSRIEDQLIIVKGMLKLLDKYCE